MLMQDCFLNKIVWNQFDSLDLNAELAVLDQMTSVFLVQMHRKPSNTKRNCTTNAKSVLFTTKKSFTMISNRRKTSFRHHSDMLQVSFRYLSDHSPQLCATGLQHFMLPKFSCDLVFMNSKCLPIWSHLALRICLSMHGVCLTLLNDFRGCPEPLALSTNPTP